MSRYSSVWSNGDLNSNGDFDNTYEQHYKPLRLPDFSDNTGRLDPEHWDDIILRMEKENREAIEREYINFRMFVVPEVVQLIFTVCIRLELPHEVRYLSLYIFDEFMRVQITRLYDEIHLSEDSEEAKIEAWRNVSLRFYSQSTLRAVSSISIAIKSCYFRLTLCSDLLQRLLVALNQMYDEKSILKSEHRVFSTIMFSISINRNPVTIMETLECALFYRHASLIDNVEPEPLWEHAVLFMDLVCLNSQAIYNRLWSALHENIGHGSNISVERERIWQLEADFISLSMAVLAIASHSLYGDEVMAEVVSCLSTLTRVKPDEIMLFAHVIHEFTLQTEPEPPVQAPPANLLGMQHIDVSMSGYDLFD